MMNELNKYLKTLCRQPINHDLEVIVVGLNKTGTTCLKSALEVLFNGSTCFHYTDLMYQSNDVIEKWLEVHLYQYQKHLNGYQFNTRELLKTLLKKYQCVSGIPVTPFLSDLLEMYPKAKVILTVRDPEVWFAACRATLIPYRPKQSILRQTLYKLPMFSWLSHLDYLKVLSLQNTLGRKTNLKSDNELLSAYSRWNEHVQSIVPKERLLVYNIKQGWLPLCNFLGKPIPSTAFPGRNSLIICKSLLRHTQRIFHVLLYIFIYCVIILHFINFFR
ncbi:unnamed protein product [Trichobilharzia szidati]|nr:unnamed protein product [Trichobilharzia szidati]